MFCVCRDTEWDRCGADPVLIPICVVDPIALGVGVAPSALWLSLATCSLFVNVLLLDRLSLGGCSVFWDVVSLGVRC